MITLRLKEIIQQQLIHFNGMQDSFTALQCYLDTLVERKIFYILTIRNSYHLRVVLFNNSKMKNKHIVFFIDIAYTEIGVSKALECIEKHVESRIE